MRVSESVVARLIFFSISFGESKRKMVACLLGSDLLIFLVGSCKDKIFAPTFGIWISGNGKDWFKSIIESFS